VLTVEDQNPGIPAKHRYHVFERFWHGAEAGRNGSELGLAIAKEVADQIGGKIKLDTNRLRGTSFRVQFAT
jgi:signal transduction histidine kinase